MVKVISLPYIFQVLFVLCFTRPRYQGAFTGPLVLWFYFSLKFSNNCYRYMACDYVAILLSSMQCVGVYDL